MSRDKEARRNGTRLSPAKLLEFSLVYHIPAKSLLLKRFPPPSPCLQESLLGDGIYRQGKRVTALALED